jgi:hypothetical protein
MNEIDKALDILGFHSVTISEISESELKQHYRLNALMYHPDKNSAEDASSRFLEVKEAYEFLQKYVKSSSTSSELDFDDDTAENTYQRILKEYLGIQIVDNKIHEVLDNVLSVCEKQAISIMEKIDGKKFDLMYTILIKYRHVFFLSDTFYQKMEQIKKKDVIELHPTLNELLQHMVYKLYRNDELYLVPLWHQELVYEDKTTKKEFIVRCIPNLEKEFWIDEYNNLHYNLTYNIVYIFEHSVKKIPVQVKIGDYKTIFFNPWELKMVEKQTIRWKKEGISVDIYDISSKSDILLHICIVLS